jgi:hypothetical protein
LSGANNNGDKMKNYTLIKTDYYDIMVTSEKYEHLDSVSIRGSTLKSHNYTSKDIIIAAQKCFPDEYSDDLFMASGEDGFKIPLDLFSSEQIFLALHDKIPASVIMEVLKPLNDWTKIEGRRLMLKNGVFPDIVQMLLPEEFEFVKHSRISDGLSFFMKKHGGLGDPRKIQEIAAEETMKLFGYESGLVHKIGNCEMTEMLNAVVNKGLSIDEVHDFLMPGTLDWKQMHMRLTAMNLGWTKQEIVDMTPPEMSYEDMRNAFEKSGWYKWINNFWRFLSTGERIMLTLDREKYNKKQWNQIEYALKAGIPPETVERLFASELNVMQMVQRRLALEAGIDPDIVERFLSPELDWMQMNEIRFELGSELSENPMGDPVSGPDSFGPSGGHCTGDC